MQVLLREVENGEIVVVEKMTLKSIKPFPKQKARPCVFEYIYFARPDSLLIINVLMNIEKILGQRIS